MYLCTRTLHFAACRAAIDRVVFFPGLSTRAPAKWLARYTDAVTVSCLNLPTRIRVDYDYTDTLSA